MLHLKKVIRRWQESKWKLGICLNGFDDLKRGHIQWIDNGKYADKKWFADPFILDFDDHFVYLLVEEFDYKVHRGRIAKLTIDRNSWTVIDCKILLDLDTHLSFPMIWRQGSEVLVCPENYHSGGWDVYHYNPIEEELEYKDLLLEEKLTDAVIWKNDDDYWLLSTYEPRPNGSELTIWRGKELTGKYKMSQCVKFEENVARNAGMIFSYDGRWIRPAQECNRVYGHAISFQAVNLINGKFSFEEIYRFCSPHPIYDRGTHTYNSLKNMAVIDVKGDRFRRRAKMIRAVSHILVKVGLKKKFVFQ